MVKMACMDCGAFVVEAESLQAMLVAMMPHYFEAHHEVISAHATAAGSTWMVRFTNAYRSLLDEA